MKECRSRIYQLHPPFVLLLLAHAGNIKCGTAFHSMHDMKYSRLAVAQSGSTICFSGMIHIVAVAFAVCLDFVIICTLKKFEIL